MTTFNIKALGFKYLALDSKAEATDVASEIIQAELDLAVQKRGHASFLISGGSSPKPVYQRLSEAELDWASIHVGLVDERWVRDGARGSNAAFVRDSLLQHNGQAANFLPMTTEDELPDTAIDEVHARYLAMGLPFDVTVMGMGTDGHTASWFPDSKGLVAATDVNTPSLVSAVDAMGCPGAGDFPQRITLTRPAVLSSQTLILFIPGAEKAKVFEAAAKAYWESGDILPAPVTALIEAGPRLTVITCP